TALLYVYVPKGFFPVQDTGVIQAITQAPQAVSYGSMAERQQALAAEVLKNPNVDGLTSFIGVDGSNITLNSGRMLINLKNRDDRSESATQIIRDLQKQVANLPGIQLYMQPVQDLTIDSTVSPTQYQFLLTSPNPDDFATWVPKLMQQLQKEPSLADVATDLQANGKSVYVEIDRATA
ncbi:efflux RND transporter permease subunit, partial [Burkholderia anthina]